GPALIRASEGTAGPNLNRRPVRRIARLKIEAKAPEAAQVHILKAPICAGRAGGEPDTGACAGTRCPKAVLGGIRRTHHVEIEGVTIGCRRGIDPLLIAIRLIA